MFSVTSLPIMIIILPIMIIMRCNHSLDEKRIIIFDDQWQILTSFRFSRICHWLTYFEIVNLIVKFFYFICVIIIFSNFCKKKRFWWKLVAIYVVKEKRKIQLVSTIFSLNETQDVFRSCFISKFCRISRHKIIYRLNGISYIKSLNHAFIIKYHI